jgi:hypothetical protein
MNPKTIGGSIWLLLIGTAAVLLIAASTHVESSGPADSAVGDASVPPPAAAGADASRPAAPPAVSTAGVAVLPLDLSPGLSEIIKLAQAHIGDDTILAYIQNSGQIYNPSADEILYLSDLGVSDKVVAALVNKPDAALAAAPAPVAAPAAAQTGETPAMPPPGSAGPAGAPESLIEPPPVAVQQPPPLQNPQDSYFYDSLAPYGNWVQTVDGWSWQPMAAAVDSGWQPYCDRGQWELTDQGWYWASDYSWGWAPFHYGRWRHDGYFGWVWVPGNDWAPAWVAWRNTEGFAGWAALPPGVVYQPGVGLFAVAGLGGLEASYGLNAATFTFVPREHFTARSVGRYAAPAARAAALFAASTPVNNYSFAGGKIVNAGVSAGQIAAATKAPVTKFAIKEAPTPQAAGGRSAGQSLAVFRPNVAAPAVRSPDEAATRSVLINKTPRPSSSGAAVTRTMAPRPATAAPDYSVPASHPTYTPPATTARPGYTGGSFQPAQAYRTAPITPSSPAPAAGWPAATGGGDLRRSPSSSTPASASGFPSYSPRGLNPAPPAAPGNRPLNNEAQHNAPGGGAPAGGAASSTETRGGNAQSSQGNGSAQGSGPSAGSQKPTR